MSKGFDLTFIFKKSPHTYDNIKRVLDQMSKVIKIASNWQKGDVIKETKEEDGTFFNAGSITLSTDVWSVYLGFVDLVNYEYAQHLRTVINKYGQDKSVYEAVFTDYEGMKQHALEFLVFFLIKE